MMGKTFSSSFVRDCSSWQLGRFMKSKRKKKRKKINGNLFQYTGASCLAGTGPRAKFEPKSLLKNQISSKIQMCICILK